ncbi:kinase-like domain-containing protein [Phyllosticta capitalensis]
MMQSRIVSQVEQCLRSLPKWNFLQPGSRLRVRTNEVFKGVKFISQQVDTILPNAKMQPPRIVYEHMWKTVYEASTLRPFTRREIKSIMKSTLIALQEIERRGFVHPALTPFHLLLPIEKLDPSMPAEFFAKIAHADAFLLKPSQVYRTALRYPDSYDAPEMLFGKRVSFPAHIWSWAVILCHLLEGRASWMSDKPESVYIGGMLQTRIDLHSWFEGIHNVLLIEVVRDFNIEQCDYYSDCHIPKVPDCLMDENGWKEHLRKKGMWDDDICFLDWLLDPNPETRPTSMQILESGYLEWNEEDVEDESQTCASTEDDNAHTQ